ncbi:fimbrial biogenesis usher protein [Citrobacter werkmanii]|uniref:fimbrial biogenesis usher protein n=1 Tax=Citrobacter werkmanii TaxID=67827 RepID=UPI002722FF79|nr:fimbrial biogenesis usher protein [Citrobacter werkmanii]MDO8235518.1 fimbrial biogenesis usher protein [Citrobacter werkmanii]
MNRLNLTSYIRAALYCSLTVTVLPGVGLQAREVTFDTDILASRGVSKNLAEYFSKAPLYLPGRHTVSVKINSVYKGSMAVMFGNKGQVCVDEDFLNATGLMPVPISKDEPCHDLITDYPSAVINPIPGNESLELFLPAEALDNGFLTPQNFVKGGTAGLINYNLFSSRSEIKGAESQNYTQANLEAGLNIAEWVLRSRFIATDDNGEYHADSLYTYAEHVFQAQKVRAQIGQINVSSPLFGGAAINGIQFIPEQGLTQDTPGITVKGLARSHQARVEVRQSGQLIYSTLVNAGPFSLENVPVVRSNADLNVSVVETDGSITRFIVPASSFNFQMSRPQGLAMSFGRVRDTESDYDMPWVYNVSDGWRLSRYWTTTASGVLAQDYQAAGSMLQWLPTEGVIFSGSMLGSKASFDESLQGAKSELRTSLSVSGNLSIDLSTAKYSSGYREITEALSNDFDGYQSSYSANISWSNDMLGTFSLGYYAYQAESDEDDTRSMIVSWGHSFKYMNITANWQHAMNQEDDDDKSMTNDDDMFYINISFPLGSQTVGAYMRNQGDKTNYGLQNSGSLGEDINYYISADRDDESRENSFNGNINTNLHYTQLSIGAGANGDNQRNYSAILSGGIAAHANGVTFSPYDVQDTFAIARLSEPESGIEITTPQGRVWTDFWGQAVVPGMTEWRKSRIEVNANTLPKSMDLANGIKNISAAHAAFQELDFQVLNTRRVMLEVKRPDGNWLEKGTSIVDEKNNYLVSTVDSGRVFVTDMAESPTLYAVDDNMHRICRIQYTLNESQDKEAFYEMAKGVCQ